MGHPEGVHHELDMRDDLHWNLRVYERCLENWDMMNLAMDKTAKDLADCYGGSDNKLTLRYRGLEILRDVDNQ